MRSVAIACLMLLSVTACSVTDPGGAPKEHTVTGTVLVPAEMFAALYQQKQHSLLARVVGLVIPDSWAAVVGGKVGALNAFVPVPGVQLALVRMYYDPINNLYWEEPAACEGPCPTTDAEGKFTLVTNEILTSNLALKASFIDPVSGAVDIVMRAMVYSTDVNVTPVSEATTQIVVNSLSEFVGFDNFTINEVGALVGLIEDMDIDISGLDFSAAIDKIKSDAIDLYNGYLLGFMAAGEVNVAKPNDIFHIMEYRSSLLAPNAVLLDGAALYESSLGGAVSFDSEGNFQTGSAIYHWGLLSKFTGDPVRLADAAPITFQEDQNPAGPNYAQYTTFGRPVGFRGIVAGNNGLAIAHSDTENTTSGFISNDGGLMAFLSEKENDIVGEERYDRGLRILMRKWKSVTNSYNDQFTFNNNTVNLFDQSTDLINNVQTSLDLNPLMDQLTYNVVLYQNYIYKDDTLAPTQIAAGNEISAGTGQWSFSTSTQVNVLDGTNPSAKPHGLVTVSNLDLKKVQYRYDLGSLIKTQAASPVELCPNLFMIEEGGSLMLRRDSSNDLCDGLNNEILAGTGAVSSDGEVFVVPQIFDDSGNETLAEFTITNGIDLGKIAARRGYYIGLKQMSALNNEHIAGVYHVVGHITALNDSTETISYTNVHGSLQFIPSLDDGLGNKIVTGTLYKKTVAMDQFRVGETVPVEPVLKTTSVDRQAVSGIYNTSTNGTFSFTLPGTTETVTSVAGQLLTLNDGSQVAMLLAIPVVNNPLSVQSERGLLLLAHEFIVEYPIPPDPPGPPAPPPNAPPCPPGNVCML